MYTLKPEQSFGLNSYYYKNYTIQFKILKFDEDPLGIDSTKTLDSFSDALIIEDLIKLELDSGKLFSHDRGTLYTYLKKINGELD